MSSTTAFTRRAAACALLVLGIAGNASADILFLKDGSRITGKILRSEFGEILISTNFAGELSIPATAIGGVTSDAPLAVQLRNDDRVRGRLVYDPERFTQRLTETAFGDVTLAADSVAAVTPQGEQLPETKSVEREYRREIAALKADHAQSMADYDERVKKIENAWSGRVSFGIDGAQGNSDRLDVGGRAEANYDSGPDRIGLYTEGQMQEQQKELTEKEIRAGARFEHDLNRRWFVFVREDIEKDKFENLELRSDTVGGMGYFAIRRPGHEWKLRGGLGYQFESFEDGTDFSRGILSLGYDYLVDISDWMRFTHKLTYYPSFSSPTSDYRLDSDAAIEVPLGTSEMWKMRFSLRNEYDSLPVAGANSLDTSYGAELVLDFK